MASQSAIELLLKLHLLQQKDTGLVTLSGDHARRVISLLLLEEEMLVLRYVVCDLEDDLGIL